MTAKVAFVDNDPDGCSRKCNKIHEFHNSVVSLALYSPHITDLTIPHKICLRGFSCGNEIYSTIIVQPTETLQQTLRRAVFDILPKLVNDAEAEKKTLEAARIN
jgi:hypothetical protein